MKTAVSVLTNHVPYEIISIPRGRWVLIAKKPAMIGPRTYRVGAILRNGSGSPKTFADADKATRHAIRTLEFSPGVWMASDNPTGDAWNIARGVL